MSIYCWVNVYERALITEDPVSRRRLVIGADAEYIWDTFSGLKRYKVLKIL